jgi:hypothetical protein
MPLPLQHIKGRETAREMMELRLRGAGLTARQPELVLTDTNHCLNLGTDTIQATDLCSRQREATGGEILAAPYLTSKTFTPLSANRAPSNTGGAERPGAAGH